MSTLKYRALVCCLALAACGGGNPSKPAAEPAPATQTSHAKVETDANPATSPAAPAAEEPPAQVQAPKIRLLSPGTAPRQVLRYRFALGPSQWSQMDMKMAVGMALGDAVPKANALPTIRMMMRADLKSVSPEGELRYEFELTSITVLRDVQVTPAIREKLEKDLAKLVGLKGRALVTTRGITKEAEFDVPPDAPESVKDNLENMRSAIQQICAPLPEEEVGKGAVWEFESQIVTPKLRLTQTSTHTLQALRPNAMSTRISLVQNAPRQRMNLKNLPNAKVQLESLLSTGDGKSDVVLDKLVPHSSMKMSTNMQMSVAAADGSNASMAMTLGFEMAFQPTKGPR